MSSYIAPSAHTSTSTFRPNPSYNFLVRGGGDEFTLSQAPRIEQAHVHHPPGAIVKQERDFVPLQNLSLVLTSKHSADRCQARLATNMNHSWYRMKKAQVVALRKILTMFLGERMMDLSGIVLHRKASPTHHQMRARIQTVKAYLNKIPVTTTAQEAPRMVNAPRPPNRVQISQIMSTYTFVRSQVFRLERLRKSKRF